MNLVRRRLLATGSLGLVAVTVTAGCAALTGYVNLLSAPADNPLGGVPVKWSKQASNVPFEGQKACTIWPLDNTIDVRATDAQICVDATLYKLVPGGFDGPTSDSLTVASDGSQENKGSVIGQYTHPLQARPRKVGTCTEGATGVKTVWVSTYQGCVPNTDVNGKPVLTPGSSYLSVGDARWKFPVVEPAR